MSVTHGTGSGDQSLVATPSSTTIATKAISAGSNIGLTSDANAVTIASNITEYCTATHDSNVSVSNGSNEVVALNTDIDDPSGMHDTMTNNERINILSDGLYEVSAYARCSSSGSATGHFFFYCTWYDDSAAASKTIMGTNVIPDAGSNNAQFNISNVVRLEQDDYVYLSVYNTTGVSITVYGALASAQSPYFSVTKLSD